MTSSLGQHHGSLGSPPWDSLFPCTLVPGPHFFTRIDAAAFISFFANPVRRLFEGGVYSKITLFSTKYHTTYGNFFTR